LVFGRWHRFTHYDNADRLHAFEELAASAQLRSAKALKGVSKSKEPSCRMPIKKRWRTIDARPHPFSEIKLNAALTNLGAKRPPQPVGGQSDLHS
jgi:hypothetical protein